MIQDYHFHTSFSDGELTIENFEKFCSENNLTDIVITDHHNYDFFCKFPKNERDVKIHTGMEIDVKNKLIPNLQLILYDFDPDNKEIISFVLYVKKCRMMEAFKLYKKLKENKIILDKEYFFSSRTTYMDIVKIIQKKYKCKSIDETIEKYFEVNKIFFIETYKPDISKILNLKNLSGGKLFLPHPNRFKKYITYENLFSFCKTNNIFGIECYHPEISRNETIRLKGLCKEFDLKVYFGSDYHQGNYINKFLKETKWELLN